MNSKKRRKKTTQVPERGKAQLCDPWYDAGVLQGVSPSALLTTFGFQSIWAVTAFVLTPPLTEMLISPSTIPMPFVLLVMLFVIFPVNASFGYFRWGIFAISILFCIDNVQWAAGRWNGFMLTYASAAMPFYLLPQGEYIFVHVGIWLYLALIEPSVYYSRRRILVSIGALLLIYILLSTFIAAILKYFYFRFSIPASWTSLAICPTAIFGGVLIACKQNQHILRAPLLKKAPAIEVQVLK